MNLRLMTLFIFLLFSPFIQAEISVSVDRNPVVADESFQLIFESNDKVKGEPDFSSLEKDFTIINKGRRSNTEIINGDFKQSNQWILTMVPRKTGIIQIPSIKFGKVSSQPYQIKVVDSAPPKAGNKSEDIFVEVDVNNKSPYVQEQIIYTVSLYRAVQTNNATLSEPEISGDQAVITKLGEDKSFEKRIKGKRYVVVQRQYAIFPQSSGTLKIEPVIFQGQTGTDSFFSFDPFGPQPKSIVKRSDSIVLNIKPIPDSFTGDTWLPASQLNIQEQWSVDPAQLKQGEATTRTLTITANGLASSNLPDTASDLPDEFKRYPDQPELSEEYDENGFVGIRKQKMAIIPAKPGEFTLPAIKIPWWNTKKDKMEIAELPERVINVNASELVQNNKVQKKQIEKNSLVTEDTSHQEAEQSINTVTDNSDQNYWKWVSAILFLLWLSTVYLFWKRKLNIKQVDDATSIETTKRKSLKQIKLACSNNNAIDAKNAVIEWGRLMWPNEKINNINSIKPYCNQELRLKLDELNHYLYGKQQQIWDGKAFLTCFESQVFDKKADTKEKGELEPLYKV